MCLWIMLSASMPVLWCGSSLIKKPPPWGTGCRGCSACAAPTPHGPRGGLVWRYGTDGRSDGTVVAALTGRYTVGPGAWWKIAQSPPGWHEKPVGPPNHKSRTFRARPTYTFCSVLVCCRGNNKTPRRRRRPPRYTTTASYSKINK